MLFVKSFYIFNIHINIHITPTEKKNETSKNLFIYTHLSIVNLLFLLLVVIVFQILIFFHNFQSLYYIK